jgi:hypothetical protein
MNNQESIRKLIAALISKLISKLAKKSVEAIKATVRITANLKVELSHLGAFLALPFVLINTVTTVRGSTLVLEFSTGISIGIVLSITYFLVLALRNLKREHPLRRQALVVIFLVVSAYTSFFSIYEKINPEGLENQSVETIVSSHNNLVDELRNSLEQDIKQLQSQNPDFLNIDKLTEKLKKAREERHALDENSKKDPSSEAGERADEIQNKIKPELERLEGKNKSSQKYQEYSRLQAIKKDEFSDKGRLNKSISTQEFIASKKTSSQQFEEDKAVYKNISSKLSNSSKITQPKSDNYVKTPMFLIPIEFLAAGGRKTSFAVFAIMIAIGMEMIPLLLAGMRHTSSLSQDNNLHPENIGNTNSANNIRRNIITQISEKITEFNKDLQDLFREVYNSWFYYTELTENARKNLYLKLEEAMILAGVDKPEKRYKFLILFRGLIDENRIISLAHFPLSKYEGDNINDDANIEFRYTIAASLFIDIMSSREIGWLKKIKVEDADEERGLLNRLINSDDSSNNTNSEHTVNQEIQNIYHRLFRVSSKDKGISKINQKWQFTNEHTYDQFIRYLIGGRNRQGQESTNSRVRIDVDYTSNNDKES